MTDDCVMGNPVKYLVKLQWKKKKKKTQGFVHPKLIPLISTPFLPVRPNSFFIDLPWLIRRLISLSGNISFTALLAPSFPPSLYI